MLAKTLAPRLGQTTKAPGKNRNRDARKKLKTRKVFKSQTKEPPEHHQPSSQSRS